MFKAFCMSDEVVSLASLKVGNMHNYCLSHLNGFQSCKWRKRWSCYPCPFRPWWRGRGRHCAWPRGSSRGRGKRKKSWKRRHWSYSLKRLKRLSYTKFWDNRGTTPYNFLVDFFLTFNKRKSICYVSFK